MKIRKLRTPDGQEIQVRDVDFDSVTEPWSVYKLQDGGTVKLRATALTISRVLDAEGKPTFTPDGQPNVIVQSATQVVASE